MTDILMRLGVELRRRYNSILRRPMPWHMIDAVVRLEETEEERAASKDPPAARDTVSRSGEAAKADRVAQQPPRQTKPE